MHMRGSNAFATNASLVIAINGTHLMWSYSCCCAQMLMFCWQHLVLGKFPSPQSPTSEPAAKRRCCVWVTMPPQVVDHSLT